MALIWSKKSSGLPIKIRTAYSTSNNDFHPPGTITSIVLDIDIYKNEPKIISRKTESNPDGWRGVEIAVTIAGVWTHYRSRVLQYFQQLAVITPYAHFQLDYSCSKDSKKDFTAEFHRRSEQMPPIAREIAPHPKSLNHITLSGLLKGSSETTLVRFLSRALSGVSPSVAAKIGLTPSLPHSLTHSLPLSLCLFVPLSFVVRSCELLFLCKTFFRCLLTISLQLSVADY